VIFLDIINVYKSSSPASKQDLLFKLLPILSPIIVIITFLFNNRYNAKTKRIDSKRAWYFKAYFEPQMKKVEEFFVDAEKTVKHALERLDLNPHLYQGNDKIVFVGSVLYQLGNSKRKFEFEVLQVLQSNYPGIASELELILMNFEDANSNAFSNNGGDSYFTYIKDINLIRAELIKCLSGPAL
jgi:hypothetical protein